MCNGYFKNCSYDFICNRLYRIDSNRIDAGTLVKSTKFLAILFVVLAAVLNLKVFA